MPWDAAHLSPWRRWACSQSVQLNQTATAAAQKARKRLGSWAQSQAVSASGPAEGLRWLDVTEIQLHSSPLRRLSPAARAACLRPSSLTTSTTSSSQGRYSRSASPWGLFRVSVATIHAPGRHGHASAAPTRVRSHVHAVHTHAPTAGPGWHAPIVPLVLDGRVSHIHLYVLCGAYAPGPGGAKTSASSQVPLAWKRGCRPPRCESRLRCAALSNTDGCS